MGNESPKAVKVITNSGEKKIYKRCKPNNLDRVAKAATNVFPEDRIRIEEDNGEKEFFEI